MRKTGKSLVSEVFAQVISYGGIAGTRAQVYDHAFGVCMARLEGEPNQRRRAQQGADLFAFGSRAKTLTADEAACLIPWEYAVANGLL